MKPETFGALAPKVARFGAWRPIANSEKPPTGGHFYDCKGWIF
ncbi:MAG: hypothetical protein QOF56_417 [Acidobacteriaceae bacterium]|nr:hypothetical protein [Acidobacteriaceae bacterium]